VSRPLRVALLGFGTFEQGALTAFLKLHAQRDPSFEPVDDAPQAELLLVSTDGAGLVDRVQRDGMTERAVFIGTRLPPEEAVAWLSRPFDPHWLLRELDVLVALRRSALLMEEVDTTPDALLARTVPAALEPPSPSSPPETHDEPTPAPAPVPAPPPVSPPPAAAPVPPGTTAPAAPRPRPRPTQPAPLRVTPAPLPPHAQALLVDDSDIALRFLELRLQALGMHTQRASTAREAGALLARHDFDIVFLDVDLGEQGEQDGLMLCQQIKRGPLHLGELPPKVVMVTAHAKATMRVRAELAGADGFLPKPLDTTLLRSLLRQLGLVGFND
jgi:CheY-like chemotaxis protein